MTGLITTAAGSGSPGDSGDGGPATAAAMRALQITIAGSTLYFANFPDSVRKFGLTTGTTSSVAGGFEHLYSVAVDSSGNVYTGDVFTCAVYKIASGNVTTLAGGNGCGYSGDSGSATSAQLSEPEGLVCAAGNLYITDEKDSVVRRVGSNGVIATFAGNGTAGYSGDGGPATSAELSGPFGVSAAPNGDIFIGELFNNVIREVQPPPPDLLVLNATGPAAVQMGRPAVVTYQLSVVIREQWAQRAGSP